MPGPFVIAAFVAAIVACLAAGFYLSRMMKQRKARRAEQAVQSVGRLAVVESALVDEQRRLVLVRCDNVEHLIMVGGPADLVVENDVHRNRLGGRSPARPLTATRSSHGAHDHLDAVAPAEHAHKVEPKPVEAKRPVAGESLSAAAAPRPALAAVPAPAVHPAGKNGGGGTTPMPPARVAEKARLNEAKPGSAPRPEEHGEAREAKPRLAESLFGRRDAAQQGRRTPHLQPAPAAPVPAEEPGRILPAARRDSPAAERRAKGQREGTGEAANVANLPSAEVPWPEADSLEGEIVRALRVSPNPPLQQSAPRPAPALREAPHVKADPVTTLGDLAERLEEALAREVQSASQGRAGPSLAGDTFAFDRHDTEQAPAKEPEQPKAQAAEPKPQAVEPKPQAAEPKQPSAPTKPAEASNAPALQPAKAVEQAAEPANVAPVTEATAPVPVTAAAPAQGPVVKNAAPNAASPASDAPKPEPAAKPPSVAPAAKSPAPAAAPEAEKAPEPAKTLPPAPEPAKAAATEPEKPPAREPEPAKAAPAPAPEAAKAMAPVPEPEARREPRPSAPAAERQEEAPVISLSTRRREPVDPLEDEMARLLGELAGDTSRR